MASSQSAIAGFFFFEKNSFIWWGGGGGHLLSRRDRSLGVNPCSVKNYNNFHVPASLLATVLSRPRADILSVSWPLRLVYI